MVERKTGVKARATAKTRDRVAVTFADRLPAEIADALRMRREARYICHSAAEWLQMLEALPERSEVGSGVLSEVLPPAPEPETAPAPVPEPKAPAEVVVRQPETKAKSRETEPIARGNAVTAYRAITPLLREDAQPLPERYAPDEASPVHYACKHLAPVLEYALKSASHQDTWQADKAAEQMMKAAEDMLKALQKITDPRDPAKNLHPSIQSLLHHLKQYATQNS